MENRSKAWLWSAAAISFIMGVILLISDNSGVGLFFILMGIIYVGASNRAGQAAEAANPSLGRWGIIGVSLLLILLVVVVGAVLLL